MASFSTGLQLYTVRDEIERDFKGTLRQVAELGYTAVEFAGYGGLSATELRDYLAELGLSAPSAHCVRLSQSQEEQDQALAYARELGCVYATIPWVGLEHLTKTPFPELIQEITSLGQRAREAGLQLTYHNHDYSFHRLADGHFLLDDLLAAVDPDVLQLELDIYWAAYAGVDPQEFLRAHSGRVPLLHLKDLGLNREMLDVGAGTLDMMGIITTGQAAGVKWFIVEHDRPAQPSLESARRSLENLQTRIYPQI